MCYNLKALIQNHFQSLTIEDIKNIMSQIFKGLDILHKSWVIHRVKKQKKNVIKQNFKKDITPGNMLLNNKGVLKISDLGLSKFFGSPGRLMSTNTVTL